MRIVFILVAGFTGLYGLMLFVCVLLVNICALSSFGVPFFAPISPLFISSLKDTIIRSKRKKSNSKPFNISSLRGGNNED